MIKPITICMMEQAAKMRSLQIEWPDIAWELDCSMSGLKRAMIKAGMIKVRHRVEPARDRRPLLPLRELVFRDYEDIPIGEKL